MEEIPGVCSMNLAGSNFLCREHPMMLFQPERCLAQGVLDEEKNLRCIRETGGNGPGGACATP